MVRNISILFRKSLAVRAVIELFYGAIMVESDSRAHPKALYYRFRQIFNFTFATEAFEVAKSIKLLTPLGLG